MEPGLIARRCGGIMLVAIDRCHRETCGEWKGTRRQRPQRLLKYLSKNMLKGATVIVLTLHKHLHACQILSILQFESVIASESTMPVCFDDFCIKQNFYWNDT